MIRKNLPSASGLPKEWDVEMERRLGYLEAQDEAREPKIIVKVLKREFPQLARDVINAETILRWIDWLDRQDSTRSDHYRSGLAAGQSTVLSTLKAKGVELEPMNVNRYSKTDHTATPGSRINSGVRLIESDGDIDDDVRAAAGGLESTINGSNDPNPANMTPSVSQQSMLHTRAAIALGDQVTYTSFDPIAYQSHGSNSKTREEQESQSIRDHGIASSESPSISPRTTQPRSATTPVSGYFPESGASSSFPLTPETPSQQRRSKSATYNQSPRLSKISKNSPGASATRSATVRIAAETPVRTSSRLGIPEPNSTQGLRERRQLGELNVGIIPPSRSIQALPDIRGKENHQSPATLGGSTTSIGLRARMMAKWNRT